MHAERDDLHTAPKIILGNRWIGYNVFMEDLPNKLTFIEGLYFTDGGSIVLIARDESGLRRQITLAQHRFLDPYDPTLLPGRLYIDHLLVPVRSEMEGRVLDLVKAGEIAPELAPGEQDGQSSQQVGPVVVVGEDLKAYQRKQAQGKDEVIRHLIDQLLSFVRSREYVRIAKKIEKAQTRKDK